MIPTIAFYNPKILPVIKQALTSNDYSMKHVYDQVSAAWLDVTVIQSQTIGIRISIISKIWTL